jgi:hypothetical protein
MRTLCKKNKKIKIIHLQQIITQPYIYDKTAQNIDIEK